MSSAPEAWRPWLWRRVRTIDHVHAEQPLRSRGDGGGDGGEAGVGLLNCPAGVVADAPPPLGSPRRRDRCHLQIIPPPQSVESRRCLPCVQLDLGPTNPVL